MTGPSSPPAGPQSPGYATPSSSYPPIAVRHTPHLRLVAILVVVLAVAIGAVALISWRVTPPAPQYHCPPDCGQPPIGPPINAPSDVEPGRPLPTLPDDPPLSGATPQRQTLPAPTAQIPAAGEPVHSYPVFVAPGGSFAMEYPEGATVHLDGVSWSVFGDDGRSDMAVFGARADDRTPRQIVEALVHANYPAATIAYEIPNTMVGYKGGYGQIDDFYPQSTSASFVHLRVLTMAAIKNGIVVITTAIGPYQEFTEAMIGHASGANLLAAVRIEHFVNSVIWAGDPVR